MNKYHPWQRDKDRKAGKPPGPPDYRLQQYHVAKEHWFAQNPDANQTQINAAMRKLAKECGV